MNALHDELCSYDCEEFIKTTCVFPLVINTRKEVGDCMDAADEFSPRMTPEYVADAVVKGILMDKRDVNVPSVAGLLQLAKLVFLVRFFSIKLFSTISAFYHLEQ